MPFVRATLPKITGTAVFAAAMSLSPISMTAHAGGLAPVPPPQETVAPPSPVPSRFDGFYAGGSFSLLDGAFEKNCGPDSFEEICSDEDSFSKIFGDDGGKLFGLRLGKDWRFGDMVYGIVGDFDFGGDKYFGIDALMALKGRIGRLIGEKGLLYGAFGFAQAKTVMKERAYFYDDELDPTIQGFVFGMGYEHYVTDKLSLYGEVNYYDLGTINYSSGGLFDVSQDVTLSGFKFGFVFHF